MHNFSYQNPVKMVFGKGQIAEIENLIPTNQKILITYGGGSIFKNGVMDQVKTALKNHDVVEFGGIEANPDYETCLKVIDMVKSNKIDFILSVGGGSVLDATKFIALASTNDLSDPWDNIMINMLPDLKPAMPFASIMTLPATGSEMNCGAVISWRSKELKRDFGHPSTYPQFSVIDPESTFSLPTRQTVNGLVDTITHIAEQYIMHDVNAPIQDGYSALLIKVTIENGLKVLHDPNNYDVRANLCWAATQALNGFISAGRAPAVDWSTHMIGHEFTAVYGIDHGQSLAPTMLADWHVRRDVKKDQLLHLAKHVFNITSGSDNDKIDMAINEMTAFYTEIGMNTKFSQYDNIPENCHEIVVQRLMDSGRPQVGANPIDMDMVTKIIKQAY